MKHFLLSLSSYFYHLREETDNNNVNTLYVISVLTESIHLFAVFLKACFHLYNALHGASDEGTRLVSGQFRVPSAKCALHVSSKKCVLALCNTLGTIVFQTI